jgi:hypothetical protein
MEKTKLHLTLKNLIEERGLSLRDVAKGTGVELPGFRRAVLYAA